MTAIITTFFFLLTMLVGHEKPCGYKRGKLKTIGAWLLMLLALADMALAVCIALKVEDTYNELDYTLEFFKKYALISILMFGFLVLCVDYILCVVTMKFSHSNQYMCDCFKLLIS